jgi:glycosyltransferase involved in cell wall biosynthesis
MKNVILTDTSYKGDVVKFSGRLNKHVPFEVIACQCNAPFYHTKIGKLVRQIIYFVFPLWFVLFRRFKYGTVFAWQQFFGINVAFWSRVFNLKKRNHLIINTFIAGTGGGYLSRLRFRYVRYAVSSKYVDKIICHTETEPQHYAKMFDIPVERFVFIPLGMTIENEEKIEKGDYIFSTGRSNRDYEWLINTFGGKDIKVRIACAGYHYKGDANMNNIEILQHCYGNEMQKEMAKSFCVVVPLKDSNISSGQLVILQALSIGKPVIVTNSDTAEQYIQNNDSGFIVNKNTTDVVRIVLSLKADSTLYEKISKNAKEVFQNKFSIEGFAEQVWKKTIAK